MELIDQVCSLEQAKRLKELGVIGNTGNCLFFHLDLPETKYRRASIFIADRRLMESVTDPGEHWAAFTASELGEMLPCESGIIYWEVAYNDHLGCWNCIIRDLVKWKGGKNIPPIAYESEGDTMAECMADALIHCLENKLVTPHS